MKKVISFSSIFLIAGISIYSQFNYLRQPDPFQTIKPGKSIRASNQFELIDDFSQGIEKNRRNGTWSAHVYGGAKAKLDSAKEDPRHGGSLQIEYDISKDQRAEISSSLYSLDVSQASALVGKIKSDQLKKFKGRLFINLHDRSNQSVQIELSPYFHKNDGEWVNFVIPMKVFSGVDLNRLDQFDIMVDGASKKPLSGVLEIDDIAFYGPNELYFESLKDNIKGFPEDSASLSAKELIGLENQKFLRKVAEDTWRFFENSVDLKTELVVDHIRLGNVRGIGNYTSPSNIAFYWLACVSAFDLGFISKEEAAERIDRSLKTVENLERWRKSHFYNFYNTETLDVTRRYVSSVDNGWLAAGLVVIRQAFPDQFGIRAERILSALDFSIFEDESNGQIRIGFDEDKNQFSPHHYGLLISEARLTSYLAIGKGDLPKTHWAKIYRTPPKEWDWQKQVPQGKSGALFDVPVFEGYYSYRNQKIVPSWGGSLFEFLSPTLLLKEQELGKKALGENNIVATRTHINYALKEKKYPVWGIAPAGISNGKDWAYKEAGISGIAVKGYPDLQIIAPYASILAVEITPEKVIKNLKTMLELYPDIYGPYGFYDAIEIDRRRVNHQYLAVDQGMIFVALANYLTDGSIRNRFHADPIGKSAESLLSEEVFFK